MSDLSSFESRKGILTCTPKEAFEFFTDLRNFRQFIPQGKIDDINIDSDSCSLSISPVGRIDLNLSTKMPYSKVSYNGILLQSNEFTMNLMMSENSESRAEVVLNIAAKLNPFLRMMASQHITKLLDTLIDEMEKFRDWNRITEQNRPL